MEGTWQIRFDDLSPEDLEQIKTELAEIDGVEEGPRMRGLDLATLNLGIMTVAAIPPLIQQVVAMFKKKQEEAGGGTAARAKITLPNGTVLEADANMSPDQLQQLVGALGG